MEVRIHAYEPVSRANGPGRRAVVWMQGCTLACPGCFNPLTHDPCGGNITSIDALAKRILAGAAELDGLSISGGEPFQQPAGLLDLLQRVSTSHLSRLVFSGYTVPEINRLPHGPAILDLIDVLVAGRYVASQPHGQGLLGSANQQVHFLTDRYGPTDIADTPLRELILHTDGAITATGIAPWRPE